MTQNNDNSQPIETHPFEPFIPEHARLLIMGTFPPKPVRWSMEFYYPNRTNDFWKIMGLVFFDNALRFFDEENKTFREKDIRNFLTERGIAMSDTGYAVRRLMDNASDKYLEIVEPVNLHGLLDVMPECRAIATTGEKAAYTLSQLTDTPAPKIGDSVEYVTPAGKSIRIFREPSTSRAYPLALEKKATYYADLMRKTGLL